MSLLLKWTNRNTQPVITVIYRSDTAFDSTTLPAPAVTLSNQETQWLDPTAVVGQSYYYMWATYDMGRTAVEYSAPTLIQALPRRGAGPNQLAMGNEDRGYYGSIASTDMPSYAAIMLQGNAGPTPPAALNPTATWRKIAYKGKVLFVPSLPSCTATFWLMLQLGFAYGNTDLTKLPTSTIPHDGTYPQNKRIVFNGDTYLIRLMRGNSDDGLTPLNLTGMVNYAVNTAAYQFPATRPDNEYDACMLQGWTLTPPAQVGANYPDARAAQTVNGTGNMCMEFCTGTNSVMAPESCVVSRGAPDSQSGTATRQSIASYKGLSYVSAGTIYLVLELMES